MGDFDIDVDKSMSMSKSIAIETEPLSHADGSADLFFIPECETLEANAANELLV